MKTALLVVDVQKIYTQENSEMYCENASETVLSINKLIKFFQLKNLPIFLIRHIHKQDGSDLGRMFDFTGEAEDDFNFKANTEEIEYDPDLTIPDNAIKIVKNRYSSFVGTKLHKTLQELKVEGVVICGFMTNFCCESTARDAHDLDYFVDFIVDATGTPGTENLEQDEIRNVVSQLLEEGFAVVKTTEEFLNN